MLRFILSHLLLWSGIVMIIIALAKLIVQFPSVALFFLGCFITVIGLFLREV